MELKEAIEAWLANVVKTAQAVPHDTGDDDPPMPPGRLLIDGRGTRHAIFDSLKESVSKRFPIEDDKYRLELNDVDYEGPTHYTLEQQKQAILHNRKLGCSLKGTWRLIDKSTGKVLEEKRDAVMRVPYYTNRGTIINNGSEYTVISQARLSPGVYTRRKQNGDLESQFNVANGKGFRLTLDKSTGRMNFRMGQANLPLYPILRAFGISDEQLAKSWGADVALANSVKNDPKTVQKLYEKVAGFKMDPLMTPQNQAKFIQDELSRFGLDPSTVVRTLGIENVKGVTPEVLLRASQKLLNVNRGVEEPDARDNPRFSKFYGIEHMLSERVDKDSAKLLKPMLFRIRRDRNLSRVGRNALGPYIDDFLSTSGLAQPGEEANPMSILIQQSRITRTGQGGISSPDLITPEARGVQGDYLGFVDFLAGPESSAAGVDVRAAYGAVLGRDNKLYNVFRNMRTGKKEYLSVDAAADKCIAFPDQDPKAPYMYAMRNNVPTRVKTSEVDYMVPSFSRTLGAGINMNPMPTSTFGQRSFYSSKFWEQYLPQKKGEVPLVDGLMPDGKMTFNEYYGRRSGCITAPFSGTVTSVTKDGITITGRNGRTETLDLVTNLPYNRMTQLSYFPLVKKGMEIKEGDILAHSNFTDPKTGAFNMGQNLKVAVLPGPRGANSVTGDTFVFWRKPDGAYTFTPISEAVPWGGMKSIAMDQKTLDHGVMDCMSWMIHKPDSPLYEVTLQDGYKVVVTGSHGLMRYDGRSGIESCRADQVLGGDLMPFVKARIPYGTGDSVVKYTGLHRSSRNYELTIPLDREFGWFIGIYLAEGCVAYRKSGGSEQPRWISIACTEREITDHIAAACKRMGASYRYVSPGVSKTGVRYGGVMKIHHAALCHFLADNAGRYAWGKRIPDCLWTAPREFAEGLVDGYFCGDGTVGDRQATATTTSRALAEALCLVLSSFGIRANCRQYKFSTPMQRHPAWLVSILGEHLSLMPFISLSRKRVLLEKLASVRSGGKFSRDRVPVPKAMRGRYVQAASGTKRQVPYLSYMGRNKYRSRIPEGVSKDADSLFARTDIWWDVVKSVRRLPASERDDSIVYDLDMSPYGTFMVGYGLIVHNSFEDACIISEEAAKKLATSRMYNFDQDTRNGVSIGKNKYLAAFPKKFTKEQADTLDDSGVVKVGTELHRGDPIIAAIGPKLLSVEDSQLGKLSSVLKNALTDKSQTWNHDWPGVVTDVVAGPSGAKVLIKSEPPVKTGDKLSPRFALKGVTGTVLSMDKMPRDAVTNEPYDMLVNPMGFLSRVAPGQLMEISLGKVAKKTGQQIRVPQLPPPEGWLNWTKKQLADAGVSETADVFDPQTGRTIKGVGDGYMYVQAMHHLAEKKYSARGIEGGYTQDQQPAKGGETGAKKISGFDVNALLSHGATEVLRDAMTTRGQKNEEYWRKLRLGLTVPEPDVPFIYQKFLNNLRAGGINVVEKGDITSLMPQTDASIEKLAEGRIIDSSQMVDSSMNPVKGGLFDLGKTGGAGGTRWSMIELPEPVPNPVMEEPVRRVLGLTSKKLEAILSGREELDGKTGGEAIKAALSKVNVEQMVEKARQDVKTKRGSVRDNAVKVLGYLAAAGDMKVKPEEWMISKVPVIPPAFRPISKVGDVALVPDTNELYKELLENKHNYEILREALPASAIADERLNIYKSVKAAFGLGNSITTEGQAKNLKGPIRQIIGTVPKWGQFQSKVVAKNQDLVGRSVTVPDKNLSMDQVGIPEDMAWTMYKPFVTRKLVQRGYSPVEVSKMIEDRTPTARHILDDVMEEKPVLMDRAPTWHKFNIMAFKPFITDGKEIRVCPMIDSGYNMDHDGDTVNIHVPASDKASREALEKMLPSKNLLSLTDMQSVRYKPEKEQVAGLWALTAGVSRKQPRVFGSKAEAIRAYRDGELGANDPIAIR